MLRCLCHLTLTVCTFTILAFPVLAQAPEKTLGKFAFDTDPRLDRHITLDRTGVPLDRLFTTLSSADLELDVSPNCAAQRLQIALHDRPLRTLLRAIAELMPGSWTPSTDGSGYRFAMNDRAVAERDTWWQLYNRQHDAALEAQRKFMLAKLEEKPKPRKVYQMSAKQLSQITDAETFYHGLSHEQKVSIANQMVDTTMYGISGLIVTDGSMQEGAVALRLTDVSDASRQAVRHANTYFFERNPLSDTGIGLSIANAGLTLSMHWNLSDGREMGGLGFHAGFAPDAAPLWLDQGQLAAVVKKRGQDAPPDWKRLAAYQDRRVWPNDPPQESMALHSMFGYGPPRMAECLDGLKDRSHLEFVADYYDLSGTRLSEMPEKAKAETFAGSVPTVLNLLGAQHDVSWKVAEPGIYLFRNNRWYRDDGLQVPAKFLAVWSAQVTAYVPTLHFGMPASEPADLKARMDLEAKTVTELSPYQIAIGLRFYAEESYTETGERQTRFPFAGFADRILTERYTALFYASLNDADRIALIAGRLPFASLNADQQRQMIFLKPSLRASPQEKPVWLRLNDMPSQGAMAGMAGADLVRGVRLEVVTPPNGSAP